MHAFEHATESHVPTPAPSAGALVSTAHDPSPPAMEPVQVPPGCYPIELVQFWQDGSKHGHPLPLHWALFVRTAPCPPSPSSPSRSHAKFQRTGKPSRPRPTPSAMGNFYELVGEPDTYTAQFVHGVAFTPDRIPDWRGTHVVGWVRPAALPAFERAVKRVRVWRHRADWRSQHWVYDVMCACVIGGRDRSEGVFVDVRGVSFEGLQKHMGRLLDAWEKGDI